MTFAAIAANAAVFLWLVFLGPEGNGAVLRSAALVPRTFAAGWPWDPWQWLALLVAPFLHVSAAHLGGNMLALYVFGPAAEDAMGRASFAACYLLGGVASLAAHVLTNAGSAVPAYGASGCVAAVLAAFALIHPRAYILALLPPPVPLRMHGMWFVLAWVALQAVGGASAVLRMASGEPFRGVWPAHLAGFVVGIAVVGTAMHGFHRRRRWRSILRSMVRHDGQAAETAIRRFEESVSARETSVPEAGGGGKRSGEDAR